MITLAEIIERDKRPPSVTVSMTCYNHAKYLDEAIRGVLMQKTNFPVNIVIHDDASPDGSAEIIRRYASENPNITAIIEETNYLQNGKKFFPKVLPHLTGKYIAYCECDDFWIDENKLQIQVDYLEANPDCVAVYSNTLPVNKYSQYEEKQHTCYKKTDEGDYPANYLFGVRHQLASCLIRNFWKLMTPEDIDFYIHVRANGDEKILATCLQLGRVHHFSEEFAAHRKVADEGDSWSARMKRKNAYEKYCIFSRQRMELYRMVEHFFNKKYPVKYIYLLFSELKGRIKFHRSVIKDIPHAECYQFRNIPLYIWPLFAGYATYKGARKIIKALIPERVLTMIHKMKYNYSLFSVLCSLFSDYNYELKSHSNLKFGKKYSLPHINPAGNFFVSEFPLEAAA